MPEKKPKAKANKEAGSIIPTPQPFNPSGAVSSSAPASLGAAGTSGIDALAQFGGVTPEQLAAARAAATAGKGPKPYISRVTITNPTQAAVYINNAYKALGLGREATPAEIEVLRLELNKAEKKALKKRTTTATGTYEYSGGLNPQEKIKELISTKPTAAVKQLGIVDEYKAAKKAALTAESQKLDTAVNKLQATAQANGLTLSQFQIDNYRNRIANGETLDAIAGDIRKIASLGMPEQVKSLLNTGSDLSDVYSPYRQVMANTLEIPYDQININDPVLRSAITPQGEMPIYDFQRALRNDPRWQYTNNAKTAVSESVQKILQDFGFMG